MIIIFILIPEVGGETEAPYTSRACISSQPLTSAVPPLEDLLCIEDALGILSVI